MMRKEKSQIKVGIILSYINIIVGNLIPIFYTPVMLRLLGDAEYGLYKMSSSLTSYLSLMSMGIGSAVVRYLIKYRTTEDKEGEEKLLGLFTLIFQFIAIATFVVGLVLTLNLEVFYSHSLNLQELSRMKVLVFLMVCNTALTFSVSPCISAVNAHEKFVFMQSMNILTTTAAPVVNLIMLYMGFGSVGMATSTLTISLLVNVAYLIYLRLGIKIKPRYKDLPVNLLREIFSFSFWVFLSSLVAQLYNATDTFLIGIVPALGTTAVAVYSVGSVFNNIVHSFSLAITSLTTPKANKMVFSDATDSELTDLAIRVGRIQGYIIALLITGFIVFGAPFIYFYAGQGYEDSYYVAILMMIPNMIPFVQSMFLSSIIAKNKHKFRSVMYLIIAIINVIGTWFAMKAMGIIGAALVTGGALVLGQGLIMNWYYYKKMHFGIPRFWKSVGVIYIIPGAMCLITLIISRYVDFYNITNMIVGIVLYTIAYCLLNWMFVMNKYEKDLIKAPMKKLLLKAKT